MLRNANYINHRSSTLCFVSRSDALINPKWTVSQRFRAHLTRSMTRSLGAELTGSSLIMMISSLGNSFPSDGPPSHRNTHTHTGLVSTTMAKLTPLTCLSKRAICKAKSINVSLHGSQHSLISKMPNHCDCATTDRSLSSGFGFNLANSQ